MASSDRILSIDIGAGTIRMAEFEYSSAGMTLHAFDWRCFDATSDSEQDRTMQIAAAIKDMLVANKFTVKKAHVCTSGQSAFVRFVKLPPVSGDEARIKKVVQYEAQQNVPFSLDEVSWDYQLLSSGEEGDELEVMLVVIKNEIISEITGSVARAGLQCKLVDISSAALLNAARANNIGNDECVMLLDIGERCSDLLFIDGKRFFSRTIPIAGHTITQQIAKEFKIGLEEAEDLKRRHGFVALGAGYEDPKSEVAAVISKIVRNVMTRLHSEINRSKSVYCTQQKGRKPEKLYLTGGSSLMQYTDVFFNEKLGVETLYFNPFEAIQLSPRIQPEKLQPIAHTFGAVIGTALRNRSQCPVEISLMTDEVKQALEIAPKKKFIFASMLVFVATFALMLFASKKELEVYQNVSDSNGGIVGDKVKLAEDIDKALAEYETVYAQYDVFSRLVKARVAWVELINSIQGLVPQNITLTSITPILAGKVAAEAPAEEESARSSRSRSRRSGAEEEVAKTEEVPANIYEAEKIVGLKIVGYTVLGVKPTTSTKYKYPSDELLANLRSSAVFDSGDKTGFVKVPGSIKEFSNIKSFEIKAEFKEPLSLIKE